MFKIAGLSNNDQSLVKSYKDNYKNWRQFRKNNNETYFILPKELENYLPNNIAINLYLYYCFKANNEAGDSWHSVKTIAEFLNVSPKTVSNWNKRLEDLGMIVRIDDNHFSKSTILLPLSHYYILSKSKSLKEVIEEAKNEVDGDLIAVYHLFEWRKSGDKEIYDSPYNSLCCVFKRVNPITSIYKFVLVEDEKVRDFKIKSPANKIYDDVYRFKNDDLTKLLESYENENLVTANFVVSSRLNLVSEKDSTLLKLLVELTENLDKKEQITVID